MNAEFFKGRWGRAINIAGMLILLLVVWELAIRIFQVRSFLLPAPSAVIASLMNDPWFYLRHTGTTLYETFVGFGGAVVLGILLAIGVVYSRFIEQTLYTVLVALYS